MATLIWGGMVLAGVIVSACPQAALAQAFSFTQVTNTTGGFNANPRSNAAGTRIAFRSDRNLVNPPGCPVLSGNADGNTEVYLFDTVTGCYTQVTNTTGGFNDATEISADGTRIALDSDRNLANPGGCPVLPGNADGNREVYIFNTTTGCFTQVTNTVGGINAGGRGGLNAAGTRVAFYSSVSLVNPGGCPVLPGIAPGGSQIFLFDTGTGCYTQVTNTTFQTILFPAHLSLNAAGTRLAFSSERNLVNPGGCPVLPGNADGNTEIYLFDTGTACYTQVTNTTGGIPSIILTVANFFPSLSGDGSRVAFESNRSLANPGGCPVLPGNADANNEIYLFDTGTGCFTQVTNTTAAINNNFPSLGTGGTRVAFDSNGNFTNPGGCPVLPGNADGNFEVYLFDTTTGCFTQVTNTTGGFNADAAPSADGTRIAFVSDRSTTQLAPCPGCPGNADANDEVFLAGPPVPTAVPTGVPTLSEWGQLAMVTLLVLSAFLALRRHRRGV
jgi:Tol biopolymer transport system component